MSIKIVEVDPNSFDFAIGVQITILSSCTFQGKRHYLNNQEQYLSPYCIGDFEKASSITRFADNGDICRIY